MIPKGDPQISPYLSDVLCSGDPDLVYRARDLQDLSDILSFCHHHSIPVTVSGSRTGLAGGGVAKAGLLIVMEKLNRLIDIGVDPKGAGFATSEPGILLGDFQRQVVSQGLFYPPDPTSRNEAQLGGTVGTNATGEDSLFYGPTRRYVRRLKFLSPAGEMTEISRNKPYLGPTKNYAGYCLSGDPIDLLIGSEGTLGIITEVTVDCLPASPPFFTAWGFFPDLESALEFIVAAQTSSSVRPRALELIDAGGLKIVARQERPPQGVSTAGAAVSFKQEYRSEQEVEERMTAWLSILDPILKKRKAIHLLDSVAMAMDAPAQEKFRSLRHAVPSFLNEEARSLMVEGGGKVSTDWWVPLDKLQKMMTEVVAESDSLGVRYIIFGHLGNGHPHINYIPKNREEMQKIRKLLLQQCTRAVRYGGGVAGEHGIGKLCHPWLKIQWPAAKINEMLRIKRQFDPHNILGRGNIFD